MSEPRTKVGRSLLEHMTEDASGFVAMTSGRFHIEWVLRALRQDIPLIEDEAGALDVGRLARVLQSIEPHVCVVARLPKGEAERIAAAYSGTSAEHPGFAMSPSSITPGDDPEDAIT